jgi:putative intracellular protease/amidase
VDEYEKVGYRTGLWLGELTHFWDVCEQAGLSMALASPAGGKVPIDPESLLITEVGESMGLHTAVQRRYAERGFMDKLKDTMCVAKVDVSRYSAIYLTGGHGAMFDFSEPALAKLVAEFHAAGKVVSAVCHGPCGLVDVKLSDGRYLVDGKNLTGFSWREEVVAKRDEAVPYSLEDRLKERGAHYSAALLPFGAHVVEDGLFITGQNPGSAHAVAEAVVKKLSVAHRDVPASSRHGDGVRN